MRYGPVVRFVVCEPACFCPAPGQTFSYCCWVRALQCPCNTNFGEAKPGHARAEVKDIVAAYASQQKKCCMLGQGQGSRKAPNGGGWSQVRRWHGYPWVLPQQLSILTGLNVHHPLITRGCATFIPFQSLLSMCQRTCASQFEAQAVHGRIAEPPIQNSPRLGQGRASSGFAHTAFYDCLAPLVLEKLPEIHPISRALGA